MRWEGLNSYFSLILRHVSIIYRRKWKIVYLSKVARLADYMLTVWKVYTTFEGIEPASTHLFTCGDLLGQIAFKSEGTRL